MATVPSPVPRSRALTLALVWLLAATSLALVLPGQHDRLRQQVALTSYPTPPDPAHPYSSPVWYPLGAAAISDCYRNNPGCGNYHGYWALNIDSQDRGTSEPVYAMGSGQVHYGATGIRCDGSQSRGNWIWIDHGGGVVSVYGHLGVIAVTDGSWVTPQTRIGTVGNSGYSRCAQNNFRYLYLAVRHGGEAGPYVESRTMAACIGGVRQAWPQDLPGHYASWNSVPQTGHLAMNLHLPATSRNCVPASRPTPTQPSLPSVARAWSGALRVAAPTRSTQSVSAVMIEIQRYVPSLHRWIYPTYRWVAPGRSTTFTGLTNGKPYRIRINLGNGYGWSKASWWRTVLPA